MFIFLSNIAYFSKQKYMQEMKNSYFVRLSKNTNETQIFKTLMEDETIKKYVQKSEYEKKNPGYSSTKNIFFFYYFYLLKVKCSIDTNIRLKNVIEENTFYYEGHRYIHFYVLKEKEKIEMTSCSSIDNVEIKEMSYRNADSYILDERKPMNHIFQVLEQIWLNKKMFKNNISTVTLNELCAAKLSYYKYLMDCGLVPKDTTQIVIDKTFIKKSDLVVKFPFSSRSNCVFAPGEPIKNSCNKYGGYIMQKYNKNLGSKEYKCHVVDGKILFIIYHDERRKMCVTRKNKTIEKKILDKLEDLCKKTHYVINKLVHIKKKREKIELIQLDELLSLLDEKERENIMIEKSEGYTISIDKIFASSSAYLKLKILSSLKETSKDKKVLDKIESFKEMISLSDMDFDKKYTKIGDNYKIRDIYMRIDIGTPDGESYGDYYVNEVEPFASGKTTTDFLVKYGCTKIRDKSPTSIILMKMMRKMVKKNMINFHPTITEKNE